MPVNAQSLINLRGRLAFLAIALTRPARSQSAQ